MMTQSPLIIQILLLLPIICHAQSVPDYMTGLLPDDGTYNTLAEKAQLITRDYTRLPSAHSLKQYAPVVRSQSQFGTCTSWATVYAARTIAEAISKGWKDKRNITEESYSPIYVYAQIKDANDDNCKRGSHIFHALEVLKNQGVVKLHDFDNLCADKDEITPLLRQRAAFHRINDYFTLFKLNKIPSEVKVNKVKKAIAEDCPVVIAMWLPESFFKTGGDWNGIDVNPDNHAYHAMCVVGYDDNHIGGGAFEIMNSWGSNWGNQGYTWVKYEDFGKYVDQAYEMYVENNHEDDHSGNNRTLGGKIELKLSNGEEMNVNFNAASDSYRTADSYISGTRYRAYISNDEPAYVYVIGSDLTNSPTTVFPPLKTISPALTYKSNNIAIPDEQYYIEMDREQGTDYMCILYSSEPLDIDDVRNRIKSSLGTFSQKVRTALGDKMVSPTETTFGKTRISFTAKAVSGSVVPIIIELSHR